MNKYEAKIFARRWEGRGNEKQDTILFWQEFFEKVLEVSDYYDFADFEKPVTVSGAYNGPRLQNVVNPNQDQLQLDNTPPKRKATKKSIDVYIPSAKTIIEQKSIDKSLDMRYIQSDGELLSPFEQAYRYNNGLPYSKKARFIITCNFQTFRIYDLEYQETLFSDGFTEIKLSELPDNLPVFTFLIKTHEEEVTKQKELSVDAAKLMSKLKNELVKEYELFDLDLDDLTILMVRLLFCMYAEDAGLFQPGQFKDYLLHKQPNQQTGEFREALIKLFKVLNTPKDDRKMVSGELDAFPYVNGGLFADEIEIPYFTDNSKYILLQDCCIFQWSGISPVLFGSLFESVLSAKERHDGGMHYTSIENIRKVTKPLFLEELNLELRKCGDSKTKLLALQNRLCSLTWFDPACGSGNFLTQTYIDIRRLENQIIERLIDADAKSAGQIVLGFSDSYLPKVSIKQFYGIEINDFAVHVAETAMQIANHQMDIETSVILQREIDSLPLTKQTGIIKGNALTLDWNSVLSTNNCSYTLGNPPFLGARNQTKEQKAEILNVFHNAKNCGNVDYVSGWYIKAAEYIQDNPIRCAFVSTNSICQGEQVANVWKPLLEAGITINFAYDTFRWSSEASDQAHVYCVIVGFSKDSSVQTLYHHQTPDSESIEITPSHINPYLCDAPDVLIWNRSKPICNAPQMGIGNKPIDGGNYLFTQEEKEEFLNLEPEAEPFFHQWMGSNEFINNKKRFVLWLGDITPKQLKELPLCRERINAVRKYRLASKSAPTRILAEKPNRFHVENMPQETSILIPETSSERRRYIPIGFIPPEIFCSNAVRLIPNANLYHFGILQSQFHNAWMRMVAGRLKSDYRYSAGVVYNNYPWPGTIEQPEVSVEKAVSEEIRKNVESCAQALLDARKEYSESSLAEMYDPDNDFLFPTLVKAHKDLDKAVEKAYGVNFNGDEERIVSYLFELHAEPIKQL